MKSEAEAHEAEDSKRRDLIEARNLADSQVYQSEKLLKDLGDKVTAEERGTVDAKIQALKGVLGGEDLDAIKKASEALNAEVQKLSVRLYQQNGSNGQPGAGGAAGGQAGSNQGGKNGDTTVDAEFSD